MKIERILLATDASDAASSAWPHVAELALRFEASVLVVHVDEIGEFAPISSERLRAYLRLAAEARDARLEKTVAHFESLGIETELETVSGVPWRETVSTAEARGTDLIVVTRHGRHGARASAGAMVTKIVRHSSLPILVVHESDPGRHGGRASYRRLATTTDFSGDSQRGLDTACALADALGARLHVIHATYVPVVDHGDSGEVTPHLSDEMIQDLLDFYSEELSDVCGRAPRPVQPELRIADDVPACVCATAAEVEADLIVLPSHGKGAVRAALIGSTSEEVIRDAPAPVLVLPRRWLEQAAR